MECNRYNCFSELRQNKSTVKCDRQCLKTFDSRKHISLSENKKKYLLHNVSEDLMAVFHVDGGMIKSNDILKCDNLILDVSSMKAIFIELKGTDLAHALEQVNATIDLLSGDISGYSKCARIVTSNRTNVPNIKANPKYVRLHKKADVKIAANILEESM